MISYFLGEEEDWKQLATSFFFLKVKVGYFFFLKEKSLLFLGQEGDKELREGQMTPNKFPIIHS